MTDVTIFTVPRAFEGEVGARQHNAIRSWLFSDYQVLLCGDDSGVVEFAKEIGAGALPDIERNEWGTPLVSDLFARAQRRLDGQLVAYVNADIMLDGSLGEAIVRVAEQLDRFLVVGQRYDVKVAGRLEFGDGWTDRFRGANLHGEFGLDYFGFRAPLWGDIPPMAVGRMRWDNWLLDDAQRGGADTVDATLSVTAIHQDHGYEHIPAEHGSPEWRANPEIARNLELAGYCIVGTNHVDWELGERLVRR